MKNFKIEDYGRPRINKKIRLTVDYFEDYKTVNEVLKNSPADFPSINDILKLYKKPNIFKINAHIVQKPVTKPRFKNE